MPRLERNAYGGGPVETTAHRKTAKYFRRPLAAAGFVSQMPFSNQKSRLLFSVAVSWAKLDPDAERKWIESLGDPRERASVLVPSVRGLVDNGRPPPSG